MYLWLSETLGFFSSKVTFKWGESQVVFHFNTLQIFVEYFSKILLKLNMIAWFLEAFLVFKKTEDTITHMLRALPQPSISVELFPGCNPPPLPTPTPLWAAQTVMIPPTPFLPAPPLGFPALITVCSYKKPNPLWEGSTIRTENEKTLIYTLSHNTWGSMTSLVFNFSNTWPTFQHS